MHKAIITKFTYFSLFFIIFSSYINAKSLVCLSDTAEFICGDAGNYSYEKRYRLTHTLDKNIPMGDVEHYLDFLNRPFEVGSL